MPLTISNRTFTLSATALIAGVVGAGWLGASWLGVGWRGKPALPGKPAIRHVRTPPGALISHASSVTVRQQLAAAGYWTPARMRAAIRNAWSDGDSLGNGLRWVHGGAVTRTTGKVFFSVNRTDYVCSGSSVDGAGQDVVLTAAHCTGNGPGDWAAHWTFVPGYTDGTEPYGTYTAHRFYVSPRWAQQRDKSSTSAEKYDVAFVTVNPSRRGPTARRRLGQVTGGQAVAFGGALGGGSGGPFGGAGMNGRSAYVFGYPSDPPYSGLYPDYCDGRVRETTQEAADGAASLSCAMTAGDSGGPWLAGFSPRTGTGTVVAVSTYKYSDGSGTLYGTALGPDARSLYEAASRGR